MTQDAPKVSVIIASYCPGDAVRRVIDSLDAQTLPQDEFEVIFVDDGSPDDTYTRLQEIASTRPNMRVSQIENSGWPSRPRNTGIEQARGEYVMFMDHDDSLYPDGLRRAYEYAAENDADVLSPKESKTNDVWWGMSSLTAGNLPNAIEERGVDRLLPMVPHKLYRRRLLMEHEIRFPEGARVLWEDWFINLDAYRHSKVVSVLADSPVYLWHASDTNSSHTFSPSRVDFWDRLSDLMSYITRTLDAPEDAETRNVLLAHHIRTRVIDRCVRLAAKFDPRHHDVKRMALQRAQMLLVRFTSDEVYRLLPKKHQAQLYLIHGGDLALMTAFHQADLALTAHTSATDPAWSDGELRYDTVTRWEPRVAGTTGFRTDGDRLLRAVTPELERALPPELLDLTDDTGSLVSEVSIRSRAECVTWALPLHVEPTAVERNAAGDLSLVQRGSGGVELGTAALGRPLDNTVWDVRSRTEWLGMERKGPLRYTGAPLPALLHGRGAVAYANASKGLSLDLVGRLRTLAVDAEPRPGDAGPVAAFAADLANITVFGQDGLEAGGLVAIPEDALADLTDEQRAARLAELAGRGALGARVVAGPDGARLVGGAALEPGHYALYAWREQTLRRTSRSLMVDEDRRATFG